MLAALRLNFTHEIGQVVHIQLALQAVRDACVIDPSGSRKACDQSLQGLDAGRSLERDRLAARIPCQVACRYDKRMRTERQRIERNGCSLLYGLLFAIRAKRDRRLAAINSGQVIAQEEGT